MLSLIFGNFLFFSKIANAEVTVSNVVATPRSSTTMYLEWDSGYSGNTDIYYKTSDMDDWFRSTANCYNNGITGDRECSMVLNYLSPGDIYSYKFEEGSETQEQVYSYFVMPTEINTDQISVKSITNNTAVITWNTNEKLNSKVFYYPSLNDFDQETISDSNFVNGHNIALTGLKPNTEYKYQITSLDAEGGGLISSWTDMLTFTTTNKPDLIIEDIYIENDLIKVKYCNNGSATQSGKYFYIKMTINNTVHTGTSANSNYLFEVPAVGNCKNTDGYFISYFGLSGKNTFEVKAEIDWEDKIDEDSESNNVLTKTIVINSDVVDSDKPDFVIQDVYIDEHSTMPGSKFIFIKVANLGGDSKLDYLHIKVTDLDSGDVYTSSAGGGDYKSGFKSTFESSGQIVVKPSGKYRLKAEIDYTNIFDENNENNNTLIKTVNISQVPCTETDNGKDYYNKGSSTGLVYWGKGSSEQISSTHADYCKSNQEINEMSCNNDGYIHQESYNCPNGCANGACISATKKPKIKTNLKPTKMATNLKGKLLLDVDQGGAIWYVDDINYQRHNIRWNTALNIFQKFALGITDVDLLKIPTEWESVRPELDTDGDGHKDRKELMRGYNPYNTNPVKLRYDLALANRLKGKFLLQVYKQGAIWYVDENGYRHSVRWDNLEDLFRRLALGITNNDLNEIGIGE